MTGGDGALYDLRMPSLGADMEAGTLMKWLVEPGERVRKGDIVAVVDTEKADIEIESFRDGVVEELVVPEGEKVPVGTIIARLRLGEEETGAEAGAVEAVVEAPAEALEVEVPVEAPAAKEPAEEAPPESPAAEALEAPGPVAPLEAPTAEAPPPEPAAPSARVPAPRAQREAGAPPPASPAARARARELGIDLAAIRGRGAGGAIRLADVEGAQPSGRPHRRVHGVARKMAESLGIDLETVPGTGAGGAVTKADVERASAARRRPPGGLRKALAAAMERANREIPHYYLTLDVELSRALDWLAEENRRRPVADRLLPAALLLKAVALAARREPAINGTWEDGALHPGDGVHLGVAISRRSGEVVVPAIRDADALDLDRLMAALKSLVERARAGSLRSSEVAGATLTVTNLGDLGADAVLGVIYPPQVALVGFGRIAERPWAADGLLGVRPVVTATLAADHRASDGYRGGRFLAAIDGLLQEPEKL